MLSRVKILDTKYTKETDLAEWIVQFLDGDKQGQQVNLAISGDDLATICNLHTKFTPELKQFVCEQFKGKEKSLQLEGRYKEVPSFKGLSKEEAEKKAEELSQNLNDFPYESVIKQMGVKNETYLENDVFDTQNHE